jgi:excisionase family DNA binding protein
MPCRFGWFAAVERIEGGHWLSPGEASDLMDVPTKTLVHWASEGVISFIQHEPRGHRRYLREELEAIIKSLDTAPALWMRGDYIAGKLVKEE